MPTWKSFALIVLASWLVAKAACEQPPQSWRGIVVLTVGLYGLMFPILLFVILDAGAFQ